jgi:hypothetical protein
LNTIDIDDTDLDNLRRIRLKIMHFCSDVDAMGFEPSLNGWHVTLWCRKECEVCRLVFDDQNRYFWDLERKPHTRNVLFDFKFPITVWQLSDLLNVKIRPKPQTIQGWCDSVRCMGLNRDQQR